MTGIRVNTKGLDELAADMAAIPPRAMKDMISTVREGIKTGNVLARDFARRSSGSHGKLYPRAFSAEMKLYGALGLIAGEYGPDESRPQGGMSFEYGSRNQKPHLDLARSADVIGGAFAREVREKIDGWFW